MDGIPRFQDGAAAHEADPRKKALTYPGLLRSPLPENFDSEDHQAAARYANDRKGAQTGTALFLIAIPADWQREYKCQRKTDEVSGRVTQDAPAVTSCLVAHIIGTW